MLGKKTRKVQEVPEIITMMGGDDNLEEEEEKEEGMVRL